MPNNAVRAEWARTALSAFSRAAFGSRKIANLEADGLGGDLPDAISDLLCNLMHYCDQSPLELDFEKLLDRGRRNFEHERDDPFEEHDA